MNYKMRKTSRLTSRTISELKPTLNQTNLKNRREIFMSKCGSILRYYAPLIHSHEEIKSRFPTLMMKIYRSIYKHDTLYLSNKHISSKIGLDEAHQATGDQQCNVNPENDDSSFHVDSVRLKEMP